MERNKMEKEFSEKLNPREIQPTSAAWDRLDAMLTSAEAQNQPKVVKRNFKWLFVAASLLGFLLIGTLFFRQDESGSVQIDKQDQQMVESAKPDKQNSVTPISVLETQIAEVPAATRSAKAKTHEAKKTRKFQFVASDPEYREQLAQNTLKEPEERKSSGPSIINQKAQLNESVNFGASADELLATAQSKRESNASGAKVNANKLLFEVDSHAEEKLTPRQRALRALNRNYQHVKVAVENRNYEESH